MLGPESTPPRRTAREPGPAHWLDHLVALATGRRRLFMDGWGDERLLGRLLSEDLFETDPGPITIAWGPASVRGGVEERDGTFASPLAELPAASLRAHVRALFPARRKPASEQPVYVALAASSDEGFETRARLFRPLVRSHGLGFVLLENPLYGLRRPPGQRGPSIRTVSEHLLMNLGMVEEARALLGWLAGSGHERLGITGFSMGGSMAALVAARTPAPIAAAIFTAGLSAAPVFTEGLLSRGIDWEALASGGRERLGALFAVANLDRHPAPRKAGATILLGARRDGYVFADEVSRLHARWTGSELRWVDSGHAGALVFHAKALRAAAAEAMARLG